MIEGVLTAIDDLPLLDRVQRAAFDACVGRFDWTDRGHMLAAAISKTATGPHAPKVTVR